VSTGYILSSAGHDKGWDIVFGFTICLYSIGLLLFLLFAKGEEVLH
jgi:hypothetical protein